MGNFLLSFRKSYLRLFEVHQRWGLYDSGVSTGTKTVRQTYVVDLLHEVAHAVVLRMAVDRRVPQRVGHHFQQIPDDQGLLEEAIVFAVEAAALKELGWHRWVRVPLRAYWVHRGNQRTSGSVCPTLDTYMRVYREARRSNFALSHGRDVARHMCRLAQRA